jgi:hypothetical protein
VETLTRILREGTVESLEADLVSLLIEGESEWVKDDRDLMMTLAPHHDCGSRLGADVPAMFRRAAGAGPPALRPVVESFGKRTDISPDAWGFEVVQTPEGPLYRRTGPSGEETVEQLRRAGILDPDDL